MEKVQKPSKVIYFIRGSTKFLWSQPIRLSQLCPYQGLLPWRTFTFPYTQYVYNKLRGFSPQANYTDRSLSAKLVATLADRGCRVVSATNPHGR
jgi:hypothetical protein